MFTEEDVDQINTRLKRDGIDFRVFLEDGENSLAVERLEFGGCEDQDGALKSVIRGYFQGKGKKIRLEKSKIIEE